MSYKDLTVWNKSMQLAVEIYEITKKFPKSEIYGLSSQMRRCSVSIPSNIAEGSRRKGKDVKHFLRISYGSGSELETQVELSKKLGLVSNKDCKHLDSLVDEVMKMLNVMINK